jgi:hypothetical protein
VFCLNEAAMAYFLSKLIPPRATFLADMSEKERAAMIAHQDYWLPQVNAGLVLVMGPVVDPAGPYGVMISNVPSLKMLQDWQAADPVSVSGLGFNYENYPMPSIRVAPVEPLAPVSSISP